MDTKALYKLGYGMYIIGSKNNGELNAQTANTVFQITSEPPTIAVSINRQNLTHDFIKASKIFSVSVLCEDTPLSFIGSFGFKSGRDVKKLEGITYKIGETGVPIIIDYAVAYLEAKVTQEMDVGTHTIFIGEVVNAEVVKEEECLTYAHYHLLKGGTTPKNAPTYIGKGGHNRMERYECNVCGYIYEPEMGDPVGGVAPGTSFENLPDDWTCPICGAAKSDFTKVG